MNIDEAELELLIQAATVPSGDRKRASAKADRELSAKAAEYLEAGKELPDCLKAYLISMLRKRAREVPRKRLDPLDQDRLDDRIGRGVGYLARIFESEPKGKELAAEVYGLDTRRIQQIWKRYREMK